MILTLREQRVILAPDLADLYAVETRVLNQAVKRNAQRFPEDFIFQLTAREFSALKDAGKVSSDGRATLRSQIVILESGRHAKYLPFAFTEHGAIMAATVLNSPEAVAMTNRVTCPNHENRRHPSGFARLRPDRRPRFQRGFGVSLL
ncbi:MAG: ORF6N domain-containing protein [Verrucomicrobiota bacterium]